MTTLETALPEERILPPTTRPRRFSGRKALALPALLLVVGFFGVSMVVMFKIAFFQRSINGQLVDGWTTANLTDFILNRDRDYWEVVRTTFTMAFLVVAITAVIGYPTAAALNAIKRPGLRNFLYFVLFAPLFVSVVVRSYAWTLLLGNEGLVNKVVIWLHLSNEPLPLLFHFTGVVISLVQILLPFMVFPILSVLGQVGDDLREAARDLGAHRIQLFFRVVLPLTAQGTIVGCQLVLAIGASAFAAPALLGGGRVQVLSSLVFNDVGQINWPMAAIESWVMLIFLLIAIGILGVIGRRLETAPR